MKKIFLITFFCILIPLYTISGEFHAIKGNWKISSKEGQSIFENTKKNGNSIVISSAERIEHLELDVLITLVEGDVAGIVFRYVDADNYYMLNFYSTLRKAYLYRVALGASTELTNVQLPEEIKPGKPFRAKVVNTKNRIEAMMDEKYLFSVSDGALLAGGYGFRTESTHARFVVLNEQTKSISPDIKILINQQYLGKTLSMSMEDTMLFYESFTESDLYHWSLKGHGKLQVGKPVESNDSLPLGVVYMRDFKLEAALHKDVSGYQKILCDVTTNPGILKVTVEDCFSQKWTGTTPVKQGRQKIVFDLNDLARDPNTAYSDWRLPSPASMETCSLEVTNSSNSATSSTFLLHSFYPVESKGIHGPCISVDPDFALYKVKGWEWTAGAIKNLGFTCVDIIVIKEVPIDMQKDIVDIFHKAGLQCILRIYPTTDFDAFEEHPEWRQIMLDGSSKFDWRVYLCPNNDEYVEYLRGKIQALLTEVEYDGLELCEPWFEVWGGPYRSNPQRGKYACLCDECIKKFKATARIDARELFNENSDLYFEKPQNKGLYQQWIDFRVKSVMEFSKKICAAAREYKQGFPCAMMHLSDARVQLDAVREYQAQDLETALQWIEPEILIIQDAWQDWTQPELKPEFVCDYGKAYVNRSRKILPDLTLKVHADIGSLKEMQRSYTWMRSFAAHARMCGFDAPVYYEFTLGDYTR